MTLGVSFESRFLIFKNPDLPLGVLIFKKTNVIIIKKYIDVNISYWDGTMVKVDLDTPFYTDCEPSNETFQTFDYIDYGELSYSDFFRNFLISNRPCVIRGVTEEWKCQRDWVLDGLPNFSALCSKYGAAGIPTANCKEKYFNSHPKENMKLSDYVNYWKDYISAGYPATMPSLYLKDWHCFKDFPEDNLYRVPKYFISDWLNEYYLSFPELNDDYRFVYMGPKGTWTPLHKDVFSSFSWSVNICGRKEWVFYPPGEVASLSDRLSNLAFDVVADSVTPLFPNLSSAKCYPLEQGPGDAVFVPSGWYHQVWNKEDTISINHNWVNSCNIEHMLSNLLLELEGVEKELSDCRDSTDWGIDCQRLLKATFGLDLEQFFRFIEFIAEQRISALKLTSEVDLPSGDSIGSNHIHFDLNSVRNVLKSLIKLHYSCLNRQKTCLLLENINEVLDNG